MPYITELMMDVPAMASCSGLRCNAVAVEEEAPAEGWVQCDTCESWYCDSCAPKEITDMHRRLGGADYPLCTDTCHANAVENYWTRGDAD